MISPDDVQAIKLIRFESGITYNSNGYAVLPDYTILNILGSVQPLDMSDIRFLPEGTHYADFINIFTDYDVTVDNTPDTLGDYFIYKNKVYKIFSCQDYKDFTSYTTNHIKTTVARDNRLIWDGEELNLPYPEIDSTYAPLYELIALCSSCFDIEGFSVLWAFQQELRAPFPFATVNIDSVKNLENTPYKRIDINDETEYTSRSTILSVSFSFYGYDRIQTQQLLEDFKLNFMNYNFSSDKIKIGGFSGDDDVFEEVLYENRTIFYAKTKINFNFVVEKTVESTMTIEHASAALSYHL